MKSGRGGGAESIYFEIWGGGGGESIYFEIWGGGGESIYFEIWGGGAKAYILKSGGAMAPRPPGSSTYAPLLPKIILKLKASIIFV